MDPILVRRVRVEDGRNRAMQVRFEAEPGKGGATDKIRSELTICKAIGRLLYSEYPGHAWSVEVMADQGVAKISIPVLLGTNWGYIIHLDQLDKQAVIRAGGEILERFGIPRSRVDLAAYFAAEGKIPLLGRFRAKHANRIPA